MFACVCRLMHVCIYCVSLCVHAMGTEEEKECTHIQTVRFWHVPATTSTVLNPSNANISSNLKVSCNTLPNSLKRGQKPFCCWGCTGCWLVCRQDGVWVAMMWHRGQPIAHPRHTHGAFAWNWLSWGQCKAPLPLWVSPLLDCLSRALQRSGHAASLPKFSKGSSLIRETHFSSSMHYTGIYILLSAFLSGNYWNAE